MKWPWRTSERVATSAADIDLTHYRIRCSCSLIAPATPIAVVTVWPIAIAVIRVGRVGISIIRISRVGIAGVAIAVITTAIGSAILSAPIGNLFSGRIGLR